MPPSVSFISHAHDKYRSPHEGQGIHEPLQKARSIMGAIGVSEAHVHRHGTCQLHGFFYQKIQPLHHLCGPGKAIWIRRPQTDHHQITLIGHAPVPASAFPSIPCGDPSHRRSMSSRIC